MAYRGGPLAYMARSFTDYVSRVPVADGVGRSEKAVKRGL